MIHDLKGLERRVRRLERTNRLLMAGLVIVTTGVGVAAAPKQVQTEIRAQRIQLVDQDDRVRMELRHDAEETGLFILDDEGDTRVGAAHFAHGGSGYALHGPEGRGAAVLYLKGDGSLSMYDADGAVTSRFPEAGR